MAHSLYKHIGTFPIYTTTTPTIASVRLLARSKEQNVSSSVILEGMLGSGCTEFFSFCSDLGLVTRDRSGNRYNVVV